MTHRHATAYVSLPNRSTITIPRSHLTHSCGQNSRARFFQRASPSSNSHGTKLLFGRRCRRDIGLCCDWRSANVAHVVSHHFVRLFLRRHAHTKASFVQSICTSSVANTRVVLARAYITGVRRSHSWTGSRVCDVTKLRLSKSEKFDRRLCVYPEVT